ncbi:YdcF family protein [Ferrigenium sp. UT5]|uniref:YdcF family protein n=1 Tax=Ferrigenium sp. UT5 TaxID=3242105 RepID=UPI00354D1DAB
MSWPFLITNFIGAFLLPPLNLLLLAALGLWLWHKRPRIARALVFTACAALWLLSTPYVSDALMRQLEGEPYAVDPRAHPADAIVVLGGGTYFHAPEYGGDTVGERTLARLRYAASLHRATGKPLLVTGGKPLGNALSEGMQMKQVLEQEFNVPVQWVEGESDNTFENARLSHSVLAQAGVRRIYLVTHAWHLPRAQLAFRTAGFDVVPAPTAFTTRNGTTLLTFVPNANALRDSYWYLHEQIGMLWYRLKY